MKTWAPLQPSTLAATTARPRLVQIILSNAHERALCWQVLKFKVSHTFHDIEDVLVVHGRGDVVVCCDFAQIGVCTSLLCVLLSCVGLEVGTAASRSLCLSLARRNSRRTSHCLAPCTIPCAILLFQLCTALSRSRRGPDLVTQCQPAPLLWFTFVRCTLPTPAGIITP